MKQASLFPIPKKLEHGGSVRAGRRKVARPLDSRRPMHLVLRAERARGALSLLNPRHKFRILDLVQEIAKRSGVKILRIQLVGNHAHLVVQANKQRRLTVKFLRTMPAAISLLVTGAKKGQPRGRFFDSTIYSRIVNWGRDLKGLLDYLWKNKLEAGGVGSAEAERANRRWRHLRAELWRSQS